MAATEVPAAISKMFLDETSFQDAVSEPLAQKIAANINAFILSGGAVLGQIKPCYLTEAQFASQAGYDHTAPIASRKWALMNGQNIAGSDFATLTGITTLPDMISNQSFIGQAANDSNLGDYEVSQNKAHTHTETRIKRTLPGVELGGNNDWGYETVNTSSSGGPVAKPNTHRFNIFIKINN